MILDVNILVAAHRHDHPHHEGVRAWFDELIEGTGRFSVPDLVAAGFVRVSTSRRIFESPTPRQEAFAFLRALCAQPDHVPLQLGPGHLDLFEQVCESGDALGDLTTDAYLAALALAHGAGIVSLDRDFARFPDLTWERPVP